MTRYFRTRPLALILPVTLVISGCTQPLDIDLRGAFGDSTLSTAAAAQTATAVRPKPDGRGVLSYPGYQVAVARRGDTVQSVGARIGMSAEELAQFNGLQTGDTLRDGEVLALPRRVAEPAIGTGTGAGGPVDIASIAGGAIDRAAPQVQTAALPPATVAAPPPGPEPLRHKVVRGESAYTVARLYNVSVRSLAEWNGLGPDFTIRDGQFLIIPVADQTAPRQAAVEPVVPPGRGSPTPLPPSASKPLPAERTVPAATAVASAAPDLGRTQTAKSSSRMVTPAQGKVIRDYKKGSNDGIDIQAPAGSPVIAADAGVVAAITADADQVPIIVVKHADNLLTVYANVEGITVKKGDTVKRGQPIAKLRGGASNYLHFEVRKGFDSVDPTPYLN